MSDPIITVKNLSKRYLIGHQRSKDDGLRHVLQEKLTAPFRRLRQLGARSKESGANGASDPSPSSQLPASSAPRSEEFWALKDVSFEVRQGEAVGIIGRNGAGKSTLLKMVSRITEPTRGRIHLKGRVASLLEVGTGFHPELTGRENIFLNGAILGMTRVEIKRKFDEIVEFAEVEKFLDMPVKRYSSGMYVRLAFAVAAHLEPEILLVDEVLAVGDAAFQRKCLGKMEQVAGAGRTVLFVSHNMAMIQNLCDRTLLLDHGRLGTIGPTRDVIEAYMSEIGALARTHLGDRTDRTGAREIICTAIEIFDHRGQPVPNAMSGHPLVVRIHYESKLPKVFRNSRMSLSIEKHDQV